MNRHHYHPTCNGVIWLGVLVVAIGCSNRDSNRVSIAGQVKLDGQPLEHGSVRFLPAEGVAGSIASGQIVNGRYAIAGKGGPAVGWNRVEIHGTRKTGKIVPKPFPQHGTTEETVEAVPPQYNTASTLKFEVNAADNIADFDVTSK